VIGAKGSHMSKDEDAAAASLGGVPQQVTPSANRITGSLLEHIADICTGCRASVVFVYLDALGHDLLPMPENLKDKVIYVTKTTAEDRNREDRGARYVRVPNVPLTRMGQVKMAMFLALARGVVGQGDVVACLSGIAGSGMLDTLVVTEVGRELEMFTPGTGDHQTPSHILPEVLERVINMASELGSEGREGKPVGTLFVVSGAERVLSLSRQLMLNPFRGYSPDELNILSTTTLQTPGVCVFMSDNPFRDSKLGFVF